MKKNQNAENVIENINWKKIKDCPKAGDCPVIKSKLDSDGNLNEEAIQFLEEKQSEAIQGMSKSKVHLFLLIEIINVR